MNTEPSQPDQTKVTVVIPTYNRADLIEKAIKSVLQQTIPHWKLLIVDDASTDHTAKVVSAFLQADSRISYYRMPNNCGQAHALNQALQLVDTKYMIQLDSDDWLANTALERLVSGMEQEPDTTAMAYGNHTVWTKSGPRVQPVERFTRTDKYKLLCYGPPLCPRFYRTSCLRAVGGWDTNDRFNGRFVEDRRIMFKLIGQYDFLWIPESLYNINRYVDHTKQLTHHVQACNEVKKQVILRTLKNWGDKYVPKFSYVRNGWLKTTLFPKKWAVRPRMFTRARPVTHKKPVGRSRRKFR